MEDDEATAEWTGSFVGYKYFFDKSKFKINIYNRP